MHRAQGPRVRPSKRRKLSHQTSDENIDDDEFDQSSPPSSPTRDHRETQSPEAQLHVPHSSPPHANQEDVPPDSPRDRSSSPPSPAHDFQTPKHHRTRFVGPLPGLASSTPTFTATPHLIVYPSFQSRLLASTSTNAHPTTTSPGPHIRGPRPTLDLTLPDAFSPSRKRGAREYIYGGIAETVRGWVVDMATIVAGHATSPAKPTNRYGGIAQNDAGSHVTFTDDSEKDIEEIPDGRSRILVKEVLLIDNNGRFILIRSHPSPTSSLSHQDTNVQHDGETWMLINTDPQSRKPNSGSLRSEAYSRLAAVQTGKTINIKGGEAMTWELSLNLNLGRTERTNTGNEGNADGTRSCKVAVLWDVV